MQHLSFTLDDLERILVERVGLDHADLPGGGDVSFADLGLDSLAVVEVQLAIQQEYGFSVPDENAAEITTLDEAVSYVNARLAEVEEAHHVGAR